MKSNTSNIIKINKKLLSKPKLTIAMSILLGSMGAYMASSSPLMADSTTGVTTGTPITVAGTLPELKTLIKQIIKK